MLAERFLTPRVAVFALAVVACQVYAEQAGTPAWIDATATLDSATTPVYEGDAPMRFAFLKDMRRGDPLTLSVFSLGAHSGTHVDAPMHFLVDAVELNRHQWRGAERLLFRTRSTARRWMSSAVFHRDFAYIAPDAAQLLVDAGVKLVGIDYISAEQFGAPAPRTHRIILGRGTPIVEGLDLSDAPGGDYDLIVLPIKVRGHEGAPARAILRRR